MHDSARCVDRTTSPAPVGTASGCRGDVPPYDAIFDMSGNVAEWTDQCSGGGPKASCVIRGGAYDSALACDSLVFRNPAAATVPGLGFRCCAL